MPTLQEIKSEFLDNQLTESRSISNNEAKDEIIDIVNEYPNPVELLGVIKHYIKTNPS